MTEFVASDKIVVNNVGRKNTCIDGLGSIIDLTLVSKTALGLAKHWNVLSEYSMSDHNYISYSIEQQMITKSKRKKR